MEGQEMISNSEAASHQQFSDILFEQCRRQVYVWHCLLGLSIATLADRFDKLFTFWAASGGPQYYASVRQWRLRTKKWMESWEKSYKRDTCWLLDPSELRHLPLWDNFTPKGVEYEPCGMVGARNLDGLHEAQIFAPPSSAYNDGLITPRTANIHTPASRSYDQSWAQHTTTSYPHSTLYDTASQNEFHSENNNDQPTAVSQPGMGFDYHMVGWTEVPPYQGTRVYPCPRMSVGWTQDLTWPYEDDGLPNI